MRVLKEIEAATDVSKEISDLLAELLNIGNAELPFHALAIPGPIALNAPVFAHNFQLNRDFRYTLCSKYGAWEWSALSSISSKGSRCKDKKLCETME